MSTAVSAAERAFIVELLRAWRIPSPSAVRTPGRGTNNLVRIVHSGGSAYVLRVHHNETAAQVEAHCRLLAALDGAGALSFSVPVGLAASDGRLTVPTSHGPASLTEWIPGTHPPRDRRGLELAGRALGELDSVLAEIPATLSPTDWTARSMSEIHPYVPDLDALAAELLEAAPAEASARWFDARAPVIEAEAARWYATLPRQIVHGDFALGNVLAADGRITGVLDFEVAGVDLRLMDLAAALSQSTDDLAPDQVDAFYRGYAAHVALTDAERAALPALIRYRVVGSIVWRAGRWRAGHSTLNDVADRLRAGARLDALADTVHAPVDFRPRAV